MVTVFTAFLQLARISFLAYHQSRMAPSKEQRYRLLQDEDKTGSQDSLHTPETSRTGRFRHLANSSTSLKIFSFLSAATNVLLAIALVFVSQQSHGTISETQSQYVDVSPYGKVEYCKLSVVMLTLQKLDLLGNLRINFHTPVVTVPSKPPITATLMKSGKPLTSIPGLWPWT